MGNNLYIYCIKYQNWDEIFIYNEIKYLSGYFKNIEIIPLNTSSESIKNGLPENVSLNLSLSSFLCKSKRGFGRIWNLRYLFDIYFLRLCFEINPLKIKSLGNYYIRINIIRDWCSKNTIIDSDSIHYTYWFTETTSALCLLKDQSESFKIVSRAHRFDLFEKYGSVVTNMFKRKNLKAIDKVFTISNNGYEYIKLKFPQYSNKATLSKLGTIDPGFISPIPGRNSLCVFSCSLFVEVKRLYLIVGSLKILSENYPQLKIEWIHSGSGVLEEEIKSMAQDLLKDKVTFNFLGFIPNSEIYRIYKEKEINVLLNVSEVEGISVSFMEAQSCSVPVIATAVGGTPEIINNENGLLLNANPSADEIAIALFDVYSNYENWKLKRKISRKNWEENFNAEKNYNNFSMELLSLIS